MAMTLRLTDSENAALELLAQHLGISKQDAAARAIVEKAAREISQDNLMTLASQLSGEYASLARRIRAARPENHRDMEETMLEMDLEDE